MVHACVQLSQTEFLMDSVKPMRLLEATPQGFGTPFCRRPGMSGMKCANCFWTSHCRNVTVVDIDKWKLATRERSLTTGELSSVCGQAGSTCSLMLTARRFTHRGHHGVATNISWDALMVEEGWEHPDDARLVIREGHLPMPLGLSHWPGTRTALHVQGWGFHQQQRKISYGQPPDPHTTAVLLCPPIVGPGIQPAGACYKGATDGVLRVSPHTAATVRTTRRAARLLAGTICRRTVEYELGR